MTFIINEPHCSCCGQPISRKCSCGGHSTSNSQPTQRRPPRRIGVTNATNAQKPEPLGLPSFEFEDPITRNVDSGERVSVSNVTSNPPRRNFMIDNGRGLPQFDFQAAFEQQSKVQQSGTPAAGSQRVLNVPERGLGLPSFDFPNPIK